MVTKLTMEEHIARAALLERWYDDTDNTYNAGDWADHTMIDADTLEPITADESNRRKVVWHK